jgi:2-aminoadipate transaminase
LAFCYEPPEKLREGIKRLSEVIADRLALYRAFLKAGAIKPPAGE